MTFPTLGAATASQQTANSTTSNVTLPASIAAGDLIIALIAADLGAGTMTWPSPWVKLAERVDTAHVQSIGYLIASGGESAVAVTHTTERSNHLAWRITGWHGTTPPEVSALANGTSNAPDSGSLTPSWGADDTLWLSLVAWDDSAVPTLSTYPTSYTDGQANNVTATSAGRAAGAGRQLNAVSEDPGAYALSGSETWCGFTVAVRPAAAAAGNVTATPGVASLALSAFAPTVTATNNKTATPGAAGLSLTTFAPTVGIGVNVVPGVASLALTGLAPAVTASDNKVATPGVKSLTTTAFAPTVTASDHKTATPAVAALTLTAFAPTVTASAGTTATPGAASLTLAAYAPTVTATSHQTATIGLAALTLTTYAPTVTAAVPPVSGDATPSVTYDHVPTATVGVSGAVATPSVVVLATATATVA